MKTAKLITILAIAVSLNIAGCETKPPAEDQPQQQQTTTESQTNQDSAKIKTAPDFTLKNYNGADVSLNDYKDKIVVLEWFNYECPFVKYHYIDNSTMNDLANKYKDQGVVWLAINSTSHQQTELNRQFAQQQNIPFPILDDRDGTIGHKYGATRTPEIYIIQNGKIVYEGAIDNAPMGKVENGGEKINYVDNALQNLTAGKAPETEKTKPYGCTVKYAK